MVRFCPVHLWFLVVLGLVPGCGGSSSPTGPSSPGSSPTTRDFILTGRVTETFSGTAQGGVPVTAVCTSGTHAGTTDGSGTYRLSWQTTGTSDTDACSSLRYNITQDTQWSNRSLVPSQVVNKTLSAGTTTMDMDLASYDTLFEGNEPKWVIQAYRGRAATGYAGGVNMVWATQPTKWVVYDPNSVLAQHPDQKNNADFNTILQGWQLMTQYADGFFALPDRNAVELKVGVMPGTPSGEMQFIIWPTGVETETIQNNEILFSGAAGPSTDPRIVYGKAAACVQGGKNESAAFSSFFDGGNMTTVPPPAIHLAWGKFNYRYRKPGDQILPSGDDTPSPFGFVVETRKK